MSRDGRTNAAFFAAASVKDVVARLEEGAHPNARNADGVTPLHWAAAESVDAEILDVLVTAGADVHARDLDGRTPLHCAAAFSENPRSVSVLIAAGADISAQDDNGVAPLHLAVGRNRTPPIVCELLRLGADPKTLDDDDWTPLHWAAAFSDKTGDFLTRLVASERGRVPGRHNPPEPRTEQNANAQIFELLLEAGSDVCAQDREGYQGLHLAAAHNTDAEVTALLLDYGADPKATTATGHAPLFLALEGTENSQVIEALLSAGANPREPRSVAEALAARVKRDAQRADNSVKNIVKKYAEYPIPE